MKNNLKDNLTIKKHKVNDLINGLNTLKNNLFDNEYFNKNIKQKGYRFFYIYNIYTYKEKYQFQFILSYGFKNSKENIVLINATYYISKQQKEIKKLEKKFLDNIYENILKYLISHDKTKNGLFNHISMDDYSYFVLLHPTLELILEKIEVPLKF